MKLSICRWLIEHDPEETRRAYARLRPDSGCTCIQCRNFRAAVNTAPEEFRSLAGQLGIDINQPSELCHYNREAGLWVTDGWYHLAGSILTGEDAMKCVGTHYTPALVELVPGFALGFTNRLVLVPEVFEGLPLVQLEFQTRVPWVLDEAEPDE